MLVPKRVALRAETLTRSEVAGSRPRPQRSLSTSGEDGLALLFCTLSHQHAHLSWGTVGEECFGASRWRSVKLRSTRQESYLCRGRSFKTNGPTRKVDSNLPKLRFLYRIKSNRELRHRNLSWAWGGSRRQPRGGPVPQPSTLHARLIHVNVRLVPVILTNPRRLAPVLLTNPPRSPSFPIPLGRSTAAHFRGSLGPAGGRCMGGAFRWARGRTARGAGLMRTLIGGFLRGLSADELSKLRVALPLARSRSPCAGGNSTARS